MHKSSLTIYTVTQLNHQVRELLENHFDQVSVSGEISNLRCVGGHYYFTLKDDRAQLAAVFFHRMAVRHLSKLKEGKQLIAKGRISLYGPYGRYQLIVESIELQGTGALLKAFEELKNKLKKEGLFSTSRKRSLPLIPGRVAVITSPTGAVLRDIIQIATRRYPGAHLLVIPTRVQGLEAAPSITQALQQTSQRAEDLHIQSIILARGGGSIEDLWAFNDEQLARTIFASPIPVVSAIGHETDFTISDFVADLRAPTPSAAAEMVFPVAQELVAQLNDGKYRSTRALARSFQLWKNRLQLAQVMLTERCPLTREKAQQLDMTRFKIERCFEIILRSKQHQLDDIKFRCERNNPQLRLKQLAGQLQTYYARLLLLQKQYQQNKSLYLDNLHQRLAALSPYAVLERGYSIIRDSTTESIIRDTRHVQLGQKINVSLARGQFHATVNTVFSSRSKSLS